MALNGGSLRRGTWSGIETAADDLPASSVPPPLTQTGSGVCIAAVATVCYFTSTRKPGVRSQPISACLYTKASAPGVPAAMPPIAGDTRVTCAVYSPYTIALTRVVAVKPSICAPAATCFVTVQVRLGVPGTSTGNTSGYPFQYGVRPNSSDENSQPAGDFADPSTRP